MFPIRNYLKQGVSSPLFFNFAFGYAIRRLRANQNDLELNGTHRLLFHADDADILGGRVHFIKKSTKTLIVGSMEIDLGVNADETKYMVMSRDQNAGRSHNIKTDSSSFDWVEQFKYLGKTLKDQNSVQEEIKGSLVSGNACYHSVQNLLSVQKYRE
jgi:hypothetical protein